jgi:chromate transporter
MEPYLALATVFARLSLLAVGGVLSVLPEMQHQTVEVHGWVTAREFTSLFALAQSAPGPNMMVVTLLGARVAGLPGAFVATAAFIVPPGVLVFVIGRLWLRLRAKTWLRGVQMGLTAVTVGLVAAAALLLARSTADSGMAWTVVALSTAVLLRTSLNPLWILAVGALLGAAGWV